MQRFSPTTKQKLGEIVSRCNAPYISSLLSVPWSLTVCFVEVLITVLPLLQTKRQPSKRQPTWTSLHYKDKATLEIRLEQQQDLANTLSTLRSRQKLTTLRYLIWRLSVVSSGNLLPKSKSVRLFPFFIISLH